MGLMGHLFVSISECNVAIKRRQKKDCFHFAERKQLRTRIKSLWEILHLKRFVLDAYRGFNLDFWMQRYVLWKFPPNFLYNSE